MMCFTIFYQIQMIMSRLQALQMQKRHTRGLPPSHVCRAKPKSRRKTSGKEVDKLWQSHKKKQSSSSPRKMWRLSSFASSHRDSDTRKSVVGKISGSTVACIPLRVIFSGIKEVLSNPAKCGCMCIIAE
jgi:site-specific DNA-cytosine methylase